MAAKANAGAVCFLATGVISLVLCAYTISSLVKYSPLFTPLSCIQEQSKLGTPKMDTDWLNVTGSMRKMCNNSNPYPLKVEQNIPGKVFVNDNNSLIMVGASTVPKTTFPAESAGYGQSLLSIHVPMAIATPLLARPVLQIVTTIHVKSIGSITYLGIEIPSMEDKNEVCGFEVMLAQMKVGPSKCARTREELVIPPVDSFPEISYLQMDPDHLQAEATKKNVSLGCLVALFGAAGIALVLLGVWKFRKETRRRKFEDSSLNDSSSSEE